MDLRSVQDDHPRFVITEVRDQLISSRGIDGGSAATTSDTVGETLGGANNAGGTDSAGQGCCGSSEKQLVVHVGLSKYRRFKGKQKENPKRMNV